MYFRLLKKVTFFVVCVSSGFVHSDTFFIHNTQIGAPELVTDSDQNVVWKAAYDPYGKAEILESQIEQNIRLPGQYFDAETGNHYNFFRDYSSSTGRYMQSDPIGLAGGLATYQYAKGNPVVFLDPFGLSALTIRYQDGAEVKIDNPNGSSLIEQLTKSANGSISKFAISGHGDNWTQCIAPDTGEGCPVYLDSDLDIRENHEKIENIRDLLISKIAAGGSIDFAGCNNASGEDNIVKQISSLLPGIPVQGGVGYQLGYENHWIFGNSSGSLGFKATYINGKKQ